MLLTTHKHYCISTSSYIYIERNKKKPKHPQYLNLHSHIKEERKKIFQPLQPLFLPLLHFSLNFCNPHLGQMRLSLLVSVLLLSTLFCEAQGIRLEKGSLLTRHDKIQESGDLTIKRSNGGGVGEVTLCRDGQCSGTTHTIRRRSLTKKSHHWLPEIHEDYYGPRIHSPKHH